MEVNPNFLFIFNEPETINFKALNFKTFTLTEMKMKSLNENCNETAIINLLDEMIYHEVNITYYVS